jgi:photosystem II stability/assembly factor-like uncharacterized protein
MYSKIEEQKRLELEERFEQLSKEIQAIQTDLGRALHEFERVALNDRLADRERERAAVAAELDKLGQPPAPQQPTPAAEPSSPFIGLRPFRPEDASLFFGREALLEQLVERLQANSTPLLVVNGLSGVGKSSLLSAGLMPRLLKQGSVVVYASVVDSPEGDVIQAVRRSYPGVGDVANMLQALQAICLQDRPNYLIVDQLERSFPMIPERADHQGFWRGLGQLLVGHSACPIKVILAVRSDWLYALQSVPTPHDVSVFNFLFMVEAFSRDEARRAFTGPLDVVRVAYDPELVDTVIQDLLSKDGQIAPPHVQIVGEALYNALRKRAGSDAAARRLTLEDYRALRGARAIIREHLVRMVEFLGPDAQAGWQILTRLVSNDGRRLSKRSEELRGNLAQATFTNIVKHFAAARLLTYELSSTDGAPVHTLTHDYLIEEINQHLQTRGDLQEWKRAEHYLDTALEDWREAERAGRPLVWMDRERYLHIWAQRANLGNLTEEANRFLLQSALRSGHHGFAYWMAQLPEAQRAGALHVIEASLLADDPDDRRLAGEAVSQAIQQQELSAPQQALLVQSLWDAFTRPTPAATTAPAPDAAVAPTTVSAPAAQPGDAAVLAPVAFTARARRNTSAVLLWQLRKHLTLAQQRAVAPLAARVWLKQHGRSLALPVLSALLVALLIGGVLVVQRRLRGSWTQIANLYGGPVAAAALASDGSGDLWALTPAGPKPGQGITALRRPASSTDWQVVGESLSPSLNMRTTPPASLLVLQDNVYASVYTRGILRSRDSGVTWELANRGLGSYDIRELVANPAEPAVVYAAAGDMRGVFRSLDGGDNWQPFSDGELFGASVDVLTWTDANGGALLAGTDDGRIARRQVEDEQWMLASAWPGMGAVRALVVEPSQGQVVYAGSATGKILRSDDGGLNWYLLSDLRTGPEGIFQVNALAVAPGQPNVLTINGFGVGANRLWRLALQDSGLLSLEPLAETNHSREEVRDLLFDNRAGVSVMLSAGEGGLFESFDDGHVWNESAGFEAPLGWVWSVAAGPGTQAPTYAALLGAIYASRAPERGDWRRGQGLLATTVRDLAADPSDPETAYAGVLLLNEWALFLTDDGGQRWRRAPAPPGIDPALLNDISAVKAVSGPAGQTMLYAGTNGCGVFYWPDTEGDWQTWGRRDCQTSGTAPAVVIDIAPDPARPEHVVVAADSNRVYVSQNAGRTWQPAELDIAAEIAAVAADPDKAGRFYLAAGADGFWTSDDGGLTWSRQAGSFVDKTIEFLATAPGALYVAAQSGEVWRSQDGGNTWRSIQEIAQGFSISNLTGMTIDAADGSLLLASQNGLYRYLPGRLLPRRQ